MSGAPGDSHVAPGELSRPSSGGDQAEIKSSSGGDQTETRRSSGGAQAELRPSSGGAQHERATRMRSAKMPAAVTAAPAPGPCTTSGCGAYRSVAKAQMLSAYCVPAKGCVLGYSRSSTATEPGQG